MEIVAELTGLSLSEPYAVCSGIPSGERQIIALACSPGGAFLSCRMSVNDNARCRAAGKLR